MRKEKKEEKNEKEKSMEKRKGKRKRENKLFCLRLRCFHLRFFT